MKKSINKLLNYKPIIFIDQFIFRIGADGVFTIGAQLSYFLILSIFPFLIVFLNLISYTPLVRTEVLYGIIQYLPYDIQIIINSFVNDLVTSSSQSLLSIAAFAGIWTAASGVTPVVRAINRAYAYKETRSFLKLKLLSVLFTIALLFLLIMVFVSLVFGELLGRMIFEYFGRGAQFLNIWSYFRFIISILFMVYTFSLLYKFSPCVDKRRSIKLIDTLPGGIFTTIGWMVSSTTFSYYVSNFGKYSTTYGSVGGVIVLLVWLYLSSIIILLGGEINGTLEYFRINNYHINEDMSVVSKFRKHIL